MKGKKDWSLQQRIECNLNLKKGEYASKVVYSPFFYWSGVKSTITKILKYLKEKYPRAKCHLNYSSVWELLVGSILSAQCNDKRVNSVTKKLFKKYPTVLSFARADIKELEKDIRSVGLFKNKTLSIVESAREILVRYDGCVPDSIDELIKLRGVGRKTANVVLGNFYGKPAIIVDTHVRRVSRRLGLTSNMDPAKIEKDLRKIVPLEEQTFFSNALGDHGREVCKARKPDCLECGLSKVCTYKNN